MWFLTGKTQETQDVAKKCAENLNKLTLKVSNNGKTAKELSGIIEQIKRQRIDLQIRNCSKFCSWNNNRYSGGKMKVIYLWVKDYIDNLNEIYEQLIYENQQEKIFKVVLVYEESYVWEMGGHKEDSKMS